MLKGILIKESICDEDILDLITIEGAEIWLAEEEPRYWTAISFTTDDLTFPKQLSKVIEKNWYCDMTYRDVVKVLVFKNKVMQYTIGNETEKEPVIAYCKKVGINPDQLQ